MYSLSTSFCDLKRYFCIWFIKLVDTLQLSLPFSLMLLHIVRCAGVILIRFVILGIEDSWKFAGCIGMLCTSLCVIAASLRLFIATSIVGYRRIEMRNVEIMVNGKGPFRLRDVERLQRRNSGERNNNNQAQNDQMVEMEEQLEPLQQHEENAAEEDGL